MSSRAPLVLVTCAWFAAAACGREAKSSTSFAVTVTAEGVPVGARVVLFDASGAQLHIGKIDLYGQRQGAAACAIAADVVGSWDGLVLGTGRAEVPVGGDACAPSPAIPYGVYKVLAYRGIEFERWEGTVDLSRGRGRVELQIPLERAWTPRGTLAADLHVHAEASNDSTMPNEQRVLAQVAGGIQVIALADHNTNGSLAQPIAAAGLEGVIAAVASNELTSETIHLGVYPVTVDPKAPRGGAPTEAVVKPATPAQLLDLARKLPGEHVVQVNHPRFRVTALYDVLGWDGISWPPPFPVMFDAVEVLNGFTAFNVPGDRRFDDSVRDFYTMIDHGHPLAPLGSSDTHDFNWNHDGLARTYVFVPDPRTKPFDEAAFIHGILSRRVVATTGPWLEVKVTAAQGSTPAAGPGQFLHATGTAWVEVTLAQARFVHTDKLKITVGTPTGPAVLQTLDVPPNARDFHWAGAIPIGAVDTWLGVTADGDTAMPLEQTGTYQRDKWKHPGVTPFAIASPILIDADGDGRWHRGDGDLIAN